MTNGAVLLASLAVTLLVIEAAFRIAGVGRRYKSQSIEVEQFDARLGWSKRPNVTVIFQSSEYRAVETLNSRGLRGPERQIPKPAGTRRILLIGDSYLEGRAVHDDSVVSSILQAKIDELASSVGRVEVVNGGTVGYSTDQELLFFRGEGIRYEPDVAVLLFYLNDVSANGLDRYNGDPKPRFLLDGTGTLALDGRTLEPRVESLAGGPALLAPTAGVRTWFGLHSHLYRFVRSKGFGPGSPLRRFLRASEVGKLPIEWAGLQTLPDSATADAWRVTEALLATLRDEVVASGSRFLLFYVPSQMAVEDEKWALVQQQYGIDEADYRRAQDAETLTTLCVRLELDCIIDIEAFRRTDARNTDRGLYWAVDGHWTARGHTLAVRLITDRVLQLLESESS